MKHTDFLILYEHVVREYESILQSWNGADTALPFSSF